MAPLHIRMPKVAEKIIYAHILFQFYLYLKKTRRQYRKIS